MKRVVATRLGGFDSVKEAVDYEYEELKAAYPKASPIDYANMLHEYCYNTIGVSSNELWAYIDEITGVDEY